MTDKNTQIDWDRQVLKAQNTANYLQSFVWAETKKGSPWHVSRIEDILPLQVFSRTVPGLGKLHYAPQVSGVDHKIIPALTKHINSDYKGLAFKLELYQPKSDELINSFKKNGWREGNSVQYRDSVVVDLSGSSEELFSRLKKRARWEVRVAKRGGISVEKAKPAKENFDLLADLINETGKRTGAFFRSKQYLINYWKLFTDAGQGHIYFAWHEKKLLAGTFVITFGKRAWYKDAGSVGHDSKLMASRYLQWEVMKDLQKQGIKFYDLSGIPSPSEAETSHMRGLYIFKTGFSNDTVEFMPAMELPLSKRYNLWPKAETQFLRLYSGIKKDFWY